jgi:hypothetical protein
MGGTAAEAKNNLGFAYERRGDLPRAYDLYLEATTLDPKSAHARGNLAHAAQALGREVPVPAVPAPVEVIVPQTSTLPSAPMLGPPAPKDEPLASPPLQKEVRP